MQGFGVVGFSGVEVLGEKGLGFWGQLLCRAPAGPIPPFMIAHPPREVAQVRDNSSARLFSSITSRGSAAEEPANVVPSPEGYVRELRKPSLPKELLPLLGQCFAAVRSGPSRGMNKKQSTTPNKDYKQLQNTYRESTPKWA